jgi:hypothetical protein
VGCYTRRPPPLPLPAFSFLLRATSWGKRRSQLNIIYLISIVVKLLAGRSRVQFDDQLPAECLIGSDIAAVYMFFLLIELIMERKNNARRRRRPAIYAVGSIGTS